MSKDATSASPGKNARGQDKLRRAHLGMAVEALTQVLGAPRPADAVLQQIFRAQPQAGSKDRARISAMVYGVLRDLRRLLAICEAKIEANAARTLCGAHLLSEGAIVEDLVALGVDDASSLFQRIAAFDPAQLSPAERCNAPDWAYGRWVSRFGKARTAQLAGALNREATVDLRVNLLRATREQARAALGAEGIEAQFTPLSPWGLRLQKRIALKSTKAYREGLVEPQDEGSQMLSLLVNAQPGESVVDWCAGSGGKTLALAAAMRNQGALLACDVSPERLARLAPRLERAGVSIARAQLLRGSGADLGVHDAVLVDAPCSASGTWRRHPELRLREPDFPRLAAKQLGILRTAAERVRPGGRLVYATCSLFTVENETVVEDFLAAHPDFAREDAGSALRAAGVAYEGATLELFTDTHATDGFYAVRLRRKE